MSRTTPRDALVVGGGVAGLIAVAFLVRADLDTLVVNDDEPTVRRNARLGNVPGFPAGVNSRSFTDLLSEQTDRSGAGRLTGRVTDLDMFSDNEDPLFRAAVETDDDEETAGVSRVVTASRSGASYLEDTGVDLWAAKPKACIGVDDFGRTDAPDIYAAGRLIEIYHQTVVVVGNAAETAITLIHGSETTFYNDQVAPIGYFTDRGRGAPPVCEEIDADERAHRECESREAMREFFVEPHDEPQHAHPSLINDELGQLDE